MNTPGKYSGRDLDFYGYPPGNIYIRLKYGCPQPFGTPPRISEWSEDRQPRPMVGERNLPAPLLQNREKTLPPPVFFLSHLQKPSQNRNILAESSKSSLPRLSRRPGVGGLGDTRYLESCLHRNDTLPPSIRLRCYPKSKPERAIRQIKKGALDLFSERRWGFSGFFKSLS